MISLQSMIIAQLPSLPKAESSGLGKVVSTGKNIFNDPLFIAIVVFLTIIIYLIALNSIRIINKRVEDLRKRHTLRKFIWYTSTFFAIIIIIIALLSKVTEKTRIITALGFIGVGLTLALQEVLLSFIGWLVLIVVRPFQLGDRVEIDKIIGDVVDVRIFYTTLLEVGNWVEADQSTGRLVNIPNNFIFRKSVFNYTHGFEYIWNEIKILVTFESDYKKAKEIMLKACQELEEHTIQHAGVKIDKLKDKFLIRYGKLTPIVYTSIADSGVQLTLRHIVEVRNRRGKTSAINEYILDNFAKHNDVTLAYPTSVVYRKEEDERIILNRNEQIKKDLV